MLLVENRPRNRNDCHVDAAVFPSKRWLAICATDEANIQPPLLTHSPNATPEPCQSRTSGSTHEDCHLSPSSRRVIFKHAWICWDSERATTACRADPTAMMRARPRDERHVWSQILYGGVFEQKMWQNGPSCIVRLAASLYCCQRGSEVATSRSSRCSGESRLIDVQFEFGWLSHRPALSACY